MKLLSKLATRINRAVLVSVLLGTGLVPLAGFIAPAAVSAAVCEYVGGGGAGGGAPLVDMRGNSVSVDGSVNKLGVEFTPQANWNANNNMNISGFSFADSGCANLDASLSLTVDSAGQLNMYYHDGNRSSVFVLSTDFDNVNGSVTATPGSDPKSMSATYTFPTILASVADVVTVDLTTHAGFVDVRAKSGAGADTLLISFLAPAGMTSFYGWNGVGVGFRYDAIDSSLTSCTAVTGSSELLVRVLDGGVGGTPIALSATPSTGTTCGTFDKTSYNSTTKTASLKYDIAGVVPNHVVKLTSDSSTLKTKTTDTPISQFSSLTLTSDKKNFNDYFNSGNTTSQQLYFAATEYTAGKALPKDTPWPIAGGTFDLTAKDVDFVANGVVLDTSLAGHSAVAHNMNKITKDGTFTLFVPFKEGDNFVGVCVGAADLTAVSGKCTGVYYLKDGQTKKNSDTKSIPAGHSVKAAVITVGSTKFWQVDGLTGSGAFSTTLASDPDTGLSVSTTSLPMVVAVMMATIGVAILARRASSKK